MITRRIVYDDVPQGVNEKVTYLLDTTEWGGSPTSVIVKAYEITRAGLVDVSGTVLNGNASVTDNVITLPLVENLESGKVYRIDIRFTSGANRFEPFLVIRAER